MQGVKAKIHNGTFIYWADDETNVGFRDGFANFTFNATLATKGSIYLPAGTYLNNIFLQFETDSDYVEDSNKYFQALVGIRPFNKTIPDNNEDLIIPDPINIKQIVKKSLTFNEKIIIGTFIFGILAFCCMKSYCIKLDQCLVSDACTTCFCWRTKQVEEGE